MIIEISSLPELEKFAEKLSTGLKGDETLALIGNLGAGKTTFVKKLLKASGIRKNITSPTFVLMLPYKNRGWTFYHLDLYRIGGYKEVVALGVEESWGRKNNVFLIEWADKIKAKLPAKTIYLNFKFDNKTARRIELKNASKKLQKHLTN
jgi:tRNA threonylcarbamoyladenosine biosynthesis protein TsaE